MGCHWVRFEVTNGGGSLFTRLQTWSLQPGMGTEWHVWEDEDGRHGDHFVVTRRFVARANAPFRVLVDDRYEDANGVRREEIAFGSVPADVDGDHFVVTRRFVARANGVRREEIAFGSVPADADVDLYDWREWMTDEAYREATRSAAPQSVKTGQPRRR